MLQYNNDYIFGLDDIFSRLCDQCRGLLDDDKETLEDLKKLSIIPTFLFWGLPGTGKTSLAYLVYKELKKYYNIDIKILRMDELISSNFGESSHHLINFFEDIKVEQIKNNSKMFIIIDEIDSFAINRIQSDNDSTKRILITFNTIIDQMVQKDAFENTIIIATTNMRESIDTALLRRFFFQVNFDIRITKKDLEGYMISLQQISPAFNNIEIINNIDELYRVYDEKKYTLGEIKHVFAEYYLESKFDYGKKTTILEMLTRNATYYELMKEQRSARYE